MVIPPADGQRARVLGPWVPQWHRCLVVVASVLTSQATLAQIYGGFDGNGTPVLSDARNEVAATVVVESTRLPAERPKAASQVAVLPAATVAAKAPAPTVPAVPRRLHPLIELVSRESGVPAGLLAAVAAVESGFDDRALSRKGAYGLMQLMPDTARRFKVTDRRSPEQNLRAGAAYLRWLADRFGNDLTLMLAAYNAGEAAVDRAGGVPDYAETRAYVPRVKLAFEHYRKAFPQPRADG